MMRTGSSASDELRLLRVAVILVALGLVAPVAHAEAVPEGLHAQGVTPGARADARPAAAAPAAPSAVPAETPPTDVTLAGGLGGMTQGVLMEASCLVRLQFIDLGVDFGVGYLFMDMASAGALAGVGFRSRSGLRFDLLGNAGVHSYSGWGAGLLNDDPGASATLPYAGGKVRLSYLFGHGRGHFTLGGEFGMDTDIGRKRVQYDYQSTDWLFDDGTTTEHADHTVGGTRTSVLLVLGGTIDLGR
jgi:hypothetical protein